MMSSDPKIAQQEKEIALLKNRINKLEREMSLLSRENNRRKSEVNQIASALRKG